jgi:hypothetical protein
MSKLNSQGEIPTSCFVVASMSSHGPSVVITFDMERVLVHPHCHQFLFVPDVNLLAVGQFLVSDQKLGLIDTVDRVVGRDLVARTGQRNRRVEQIPRSDRPSLSRHGLITPFQEAMPGTRTQPAESAVCGKSRTRRKTNAPLARSLAMPDRHKHKIGFRNIRSNHRRWLCPCRSLRDSLRPNLAQTTMR